jgi:hypothetical protein
MWTDLHTEVLGEFVDAQAPMVNVLARNWMRAHSNYMLRRKLAKKAWTLRAMRQRLFNTPVIACANAKCRVQFVPYRKNIKYCSNVCRVRELGLKAHYKRRKPLPTRTCRVCLGPFSQRRRHAIYCSRRCRCAAKYRLIKAAAVRKPLPTRTCAICRETFTERRRDAIYCSARCLRAAKYRRSKVAA